MRLVLFLACISLAAGGVQRKEQNKFLTKLQRFKIDFWRGKLGVERLRRLQEAFSPDISLADVLNEPMSLGDFWPFLLLDEGAIEPEGQTGDGVQKKVDQNIDSNLGIFQMNSPKSTENDNDTKVVIYNSERKSFQVFSFSEFFAELTTSRQSPGVLAAGLAALAQFAERVVVLFGQSVAEVQKVLEQVGMELLGQNRFPVGVVAPEHGPAIQLQPSSVGGVPSEQELLDQLNIALEVMANDEHFNADEADAAHLDHLALEQILHQPLVETESYLDHLGPRKKNIKDQIRGKRRILLVRLEEMFGSSHGKKELALALERALFQRGGWMSVLQPLSERRRTLIPGYEASPYIVTFFDFLLGPRMSKRADRGYFPSLNFLGEALKLKVGSLGRVKASLAGMLDAYAQVDHQMEDFPDSNKDVCLLVPRGENRKHLETTCYHKTTSYLGPCKGEFETSSGNLCSPEDFELSLFNDDEVVMKIIHDTYFKYPLKEQKETVAEPVAVVGTGSSSWPWHTRRLSDENNCECLSEYELFLVTGVKIGFLPCTQPIPWCFVDGNSECPDAVIKSYDFPAVLWSQKACANYPRPPGPSYF